MIKDFFEFQKVAREVLTWNDNKVCELVAYKTDDYAVDNEVEILLRCHAMVHDNNVSPDEAIPVCYAWLVAAQEQLGIKIGTPNELIDPMSDQVVVLKTQRLGGKMGDKQGHFTYVLPKLPPHRIDLNTYWTAVMYRGGCIL